MHTHVYLDTLLYLACYIAVVRSRRIVHQIDAPPDFALVSWPAGKPIPWVDGRLRLPSYTYDDNRGYDMYISLIDSGVNLNDTVKTKPSHHLFTSCNT